VALGRNGDQTCGCLLSWRERVLISLVTKDFLRRIPPVAGRSSEGALTEPTADARACRWELVKVPDRAATGVNRRRIVIPSGRRSAGPEPSQSKRRCA